MYLTFRATEAADLMQKLSLDPQAKTENSQSPKKVCANCVTLVLVPLVTCVFVSVSNLVYLQPIVDSGNVPNGQIQSSDRSLTPLLPDPMDPTMWYANGYAPYYYGGNFIILNINFFLND